MRRIRLFLVTLVLVVVLLSAPVSVVGASSNPDFEVYLPENIVEPGEETELDLEIRNAAPEDNDTAPGEDPQDEARNVVVTLEDGDAPISVKTDETPIRSMSGDSLTSESFTVAVDEDAEAGTYEADVEIEYVYTTGSGMEWSETETETVEIVVEERARFSAVTNDSGLSVGETGTVSIDLENQGEEMASDAVVTVDSPSSELDALGENVEQHVGDWDEGENVTVDADFTVSEEAIARTYPIDVTVEFRDDDGVDQTSRELRVGAEATPDASFVAETVDSKLIVGDSGDVSVAVENTRGYDVEDAVVTLEPSDPDLEASEDWTEQYVGDWKAGETVTIDGRFALDEDAVARSYSVSAVVDYRLNGTERTSREMRVGADALDSQSFGVENVESTLRVGDDGTVNGTLVNEGPEPVENAVVHIDGEDIVAGADGFDLDSGGEPGIDLGPNVFARETQYAVGDLEVGEEASFDLWLGVSDEGEPGPRLLELDVRYRTLDDDVRMSEPVDATVEIAESREEFGVEAVDAELDAGETERLELEVTNTDDQTLRDVEAKLFTSDPLEDGGDDAFIPELEPGESTTVAFEVTAEDGATPQTYPVRVDFQYEDDRGDLQLSDTYRVPVTVVEPDGGIVSAWLLAALGGLLAAAAGGWWYVSARRSGTDHDIELPAWIPGGDDGGEDDPAADADGASDSLEFDEGSLAGDAGLEDDPLVDDLGLEEDDQTDGESASFPAGEELSPDEHRSRSGDDG